MHKFSKNHGAIKVLFAISIFLLCIAVLMAWGNISGTIGLREGFSEPDLFDHKIDEVQQTYSTQPTINLPVGFLYANTLTQLAKTLLYKPGGYLSNDIAPHSKKLNNLKNWEYGVLVLLRDGTSVLRNHFAYISGQSEDPDLALVEPYFYFPYDRWALPSTEAEYKKGIKAMNRYMARLERGKDRHPRSRFRDGADELSQYIQVVVLRVSGLQTRLNTNSSKKDYKRPVSVDPYKMYYEARGATWSLIHIFTAIKYDFSDILTNRRAIGLIDKVILELKNGLTESNGEEICIPCLTDHLKLAKHDLITVHSLLKPHGRAG